MKQMSIPYIPLPELSALMKTFWTLPTRGDRWLLSEDEQRIQFFSLGQYALRAGIETILVHGNEKEGGIWLPDYFCNDALNCFRFRQRQFSFYPIQENLQPDWNRLEPLARKVGPPKVLILVHYFGFPNDVREAQKFCNKWGAELIEDAAHVLMPTGSIGNCENIVIYSPRKILALPECGVAVFPRRINDNALHTDIVNSRKKVCSWLVRRLTQKILVALRIPWHHFSPQGYSITSSAITESTEEREPSNSPTRFTLKLLTIAERMFEEIVAKRRANYEQLCSAFSGNKRIRLLFPHLLEDVCPFVFPFIVHEGRDKIIDELKKSGVPANYWPKLPPEVVASEANYRVAHWLQHNIVGVSIHQSIRPQQMEYMIANLRRVLSN